MTSPLPAAHAIILAGGRGTRFWPRSRMRSPKQLLNIVGQKTMLVQTFERLAPIFAASAPGLLQIANKPVPCAGDCPRSLRGTC